MENKAKEAILRATFKLLLEKGYDAVSITGIQQAAGVSRGLLYHYYKNKEELFIDVTERYFVDLFRIDWAQVAAFTVPEMVAYMEQKHREVCRVSQIGGDARMSIINYDFLFYQVISKSPGFALHYRQVRNDELSVWQQVVRNTMNAGRLKPELDVSVTAHIFVYIIDGVWFNESTYRDPEEVIREISRLLMQYYEQIKKEN